MSVRQAVIMLKIINLDPLISTIFLCHLTTSWCYIQRLHRSILVPLGQYPPLQRIQMVVMFFHLLLFFASLFPSLSFPSSPSPLIISGKFSSPSCCSSHKHPGENGTGRGNPSTGKTAYQPWLLLHPLCNNHRCPKIWVSLFLDLLFNCWYCAPCHLQSGTWSTWKMSVEQEVLFFFLCCREAEEFLLPYFVCLVLPRMSVVDFLLHLSSDYAVLF